MAENSDSQGLIARVTTALRYAATGAMPTGWFGPGTPLAPQAPADVRGRQFDYPTVFNVNYRPRAGEKINFEALKRLATHPVVAMLIQRQKDKVTALDWQILPRKTGAPGADKAPTDPMIQMITDFLTFPDKEHDWGQWIGALLDQLLVIDAVTVYAAPTRGGDLYALQLLDGATIKPIIDLGGRRPLAPDPAYQQALKGMPAVDYTADEIIYFPHTYRPDRVYGYSRVEQAHDLVEAAIARLKSQKGYFDFGNIGDGFFTAPDSWTPDMVKGLEASWNAMMQGDPAIRRNAPMLPMGTEWHPTKTEILADAYDEFLIRLLCFPFGVSPTPFMKQSGLGHGSAATDHDAAEEGGIAPLMQYVTRLMNFIIVKWFKRPDLQFSFVEDREFDPVLKAKIEDQRLRNGTLTINQVLDRNGDAPVEGGDIPLLFTGTAWVTLDSILNPPPPPEPVAPIAPIAPGEGDAAAPPAAKEPSPALKKSADAAADLGDPGEQPDTLKKAADAAAEKHFAIVVRAYLSAKAQKIASTVADKLTKSDPAMDDQHGRIESALDGDDWHWDDFPPIVEPLIAGVAVAAGSDALSTLGLFDADTLKRVSARSTTYAQERGAEMVGMKWVDGELVENPDATWSISATTRNQLRDAIAKAMDEGQSNAQLAKTIMEDPAFGAARANTIARSETALADVRGAAAGWIESGVVGGAEFNASPDCCEECQDEDGKIVELAEPDDLDLPHPNCRCSWSAILTEDMPGADGAQAED